MNIPKFEGREIVPRVKPKRISAEFLGGKFGRAVDQEVHKRYGDISAISNVGYNDDIEEVVGSNTIYVTAVNEVIRPKGLRTMTVDDIRQIKNSDSLDLTKSYEDIGLVKRGMGSYLAEKFVIDGNPKLPVTINIADCRLERDDKSEYDVAIIPNSDAQIIPGDIADYKGSQALSRLYLDRDLDLTSDWGDLDDSDSGGRVVIVEDLE